MTIRAKFLCRAKEEYADPKNCGTVTLSAVTSGSEENKTFWKWTPSGEVKLFTVNEAAFAAFKIGALYYVDFIEAPSE